MPAKPKQPVRSLTNQEVADRLGLHHSYVSRMRSGQRVASRSVLVSISNEFDIPVVALLAAAESAASGNPKEWRKLLELGFVGEAPLTDGQAV